jgi:putative oxidoreductase
MKQKIFYTENGWAPLLMRVLLSIVLWAHGAQKLLGWFGGYGFENSMKFFTGTVGIPSVLGFLVIVLEFFGSLFVLAGLLTRVWASLMTLLFIAIPISSHLANGFFMNWFGNQPGEGYEFFLLAIGLSAGLVIEGGGRYSVDRQLTNRNKDR